MNLLLAHSDDGSPVLELDPEASSAAREASPVRRRPPEGFLADITADANDLARQGWAVVAPEGDVGDELVDAVRPLMEARATEQGSEVLLLRVPRGMDAEQATLWKKDHYPALYDKDEQRRPRYLLILGDLDQLSLETQQALAVDGLPGRVAFDDPAAYAAYARKVLRWEREPSRHERARALLYTVHDGTRATAEGHAKLMRPCFQRCSRKQREEPREFPASAVEAAGAPAPDPNELLRLVEPCQPSVLLSLSHGLAPPSWQRWTRAEARQRQGAMSFGEAGALMPEDVAAAPFLPGGMWIYFACFGAGTPRRSAYHHWLEMLSRHRMECGGLMSEVLSGLDEDGGGFTSGLARAALANPDGPLAVLGHVDMAWSYGYEELRVSREGGEHRITGSDRSQNFFHVMRKMVAGERAGAACLALGRVIDDVSRELNTWYDRSQQRGGNTGDVDTLDGLALGNLWMLRQDLLGYALLGDPAVRLPLSPVHAARTHFGAAAGADKDELGRWEHAVLRVACEESPGVVAGESSLSRGELIEAEQRYREAGRAALARFLGELRGR
jgi:hypothetical protein